jgi:hypothetical protein
MTIESDGEEENEDPNVTTTYVKETEISGDMMTRTTETTTTTVNPDGTETIVVTESVEVFMGGELTSSDSTVVSTETQPTTAVYVPVEGELGEPESVGLTEEDAIAEADAAEGTTVTEITTTVTETTGGDDEPESVGLTEEDALAEADAAEGTTVTEITTTVTTEEGADAAEPTTVGLTEEQAAAEPTTVGLTEEQAAAEVAEVVATEGSTPKVEEDECCGGNDVKINIEFVVNVAG